MWEEPVLTPDLHPTTSISFFFTNIIQTIEKKIIKKKIDSWQRFFALEVNLANYIIKRHLIPRGSESTKEEGPKLTYKVLYKHLHTVFITCCLCRL